jgi:hypothetical protein
VLFIVPKVAAFVSRELALFLRIFVMAGAAPKSVGNRMASWAGTFYSAMVIGLSVVASNSIADERVVSPPESGWVRLFDGSSFAGWYTKVQNHQKNDDPGKIFQIEDGTIHVYKDQLQGTAVPSGYLATEAEFENYQLRIEYKWGEKRFAPRAMQRRDAGLLYHVVGADIVWPRCIECQIQEYDVGDGFTVRGAQVDVSGELVDAEKKIFRYKGKSEGGTPQTVGDGSICRVIKSSMNEHDGWNTTEIEVHGGGGSKHIVNGATVFESTAVRQFGPPEEASKPRAKDGDARTWQPLARGKIALQAEYAEVFYRNIEIKTLPAAELRQDK